MSNLRKKQTPPKGRVKADSNAPAQAGGTQMEVYRGAGYTEDPAIHSTDQKPQEGGMPKPPVAPTVPQSIPLEPKKDRNTILTSPLPLVVSAPEAIEKMEHLNDMITEGRPDLSNESQAVAQALDVLERKALGDAAYAQHEAGEGEVPAGGQAAPALVVGDRVVMALEDGEYQGEIQVVNQDGTYDVKTDQMATFRRVPATSVAKPEMLQPIAPRASKKEKAIMPKTKGSKIRAMKEGYNLVDGVKIVEEGGKPRAFKDEDDTVPAELYANAEGKLALMGPDGQANYEDAANDEVEFSYWKQVHALVPKAKSPEAKPADAPAAAAAPAPAPVAASKADDVETAFEAVIAMGEGEKADRALDRAIKKAKPVWDAETDKKFASEALKSTTAEIAEMALRKYRSAKGKVTSALSEKIKASGRLKMEGAMYTDQTKGAVKITFADKKLVDLWNHECIGQLSDGAWENADGANWLWMAGDAKKGAENKITYDKSQLPREARKKIRKNYDFTEIADYSSPPMDELFGGQEGLIKALETIGKTVRQAQDITPAGDLDASKAEPTAAEKLLVAHKVKAENFFIVQQGQPVQASSMASLTQALEAGLKPESIQAIFADKAAADRFYAIVAGKPSEAEIEKEAKEMLEVADSDLDEAKEAVSESSENSDMASFEQASDSAKDAADAAKAASEDAGVARRLFRRLKPEGGKPKTAEQLKKEGWTEGEDKRFDSRGERILYNQNTGDIRSMPKKSKPVKASENIIAKGLASELRKDDTFAAVIPAEVKADQKIVIKASKDGVLSAKVQGTGGDDRAETAIFHALEGDKSFFGGVDLEYPGYLAFYHIPNMPEGYTLLATPWHDGDDELSIQLNGPDEEPIYSDAVPFPLETAPMEEQVAAYKEAITNVMPTLMEKAKTETYTGPRGSKTVKGASDTDIKISLSTAEQGFEEAADLTKDSTKALKNGDRRKAQGEVQKAISMSESAEHSARGAEEALSASKPKVEASAFDEIPELEIGGGMIAKRKKAGKKEGAEEEGSEIEVTDKDGKVVATYPDAFGDDTVMIIKFLRQVLDIKESDDKKAGKEEEKGDKPDKPDKAEKGEKNEKGDSAEDKPLVLPKVEKDKDEEKDKENSELAARAAKLEARITDCRMVVEAMLRKGHVVADQAEVDAELLKGLSLRQAQVVAARKAVDKQVMILLAKPDAELQVIKASLPLLTARQVRIQASEGGLTPVNLTASGLIDESAPKGSVVGLALTGAFRR